MGKDKTQAETEENDLKNQRSLIKRNITNIKTKVEKDGDLVHHTALECRLQILESHFKEICRLQTKIEILNSNDDCRSAIEDSYIEAKTAILKRINKSRSHDTDQSVLNTTITNMPHHNRLPQLKLPKFDGKYSEYSRFINTFNTLVNEDMSIPIIDKFNYLLNCLSGQALSVIEPFQVIEANYEKALERLKERYDNKTLIFIETVNTLFAISPITKPNAPALRSIVDNVAAIRGSLLSLGSELDVVNAMIIQILLSKIDHDSKTVYNDKQDLNKLPSWDECYSILSRRCQFLESSSPQMPQTSEREMKGKYKDRRPGTSLLVSNIFCEYCKSKDHYIGGCPSYLALPVPRRFENIKVAGLCINCLRKGHMVAKCQSKSRCRECHISHHTSLHNPYSQLHNEPQNFSNQNVRHSSSQASSSNTLSFNAKPYQPQNSSQPSNQPNTTKPTTSSASIHLTTHSSFVTRSYRQSMLPTAVVLIKDSFGTLQPVRALLDSCSEINLITQETVNRLHLPQSKSNQEIAGVSEIRTQVKSVVSATVKSRTSNFEWSSNFFVTKSISSHQPAERINVVNWKIPNNIELADPQFFMPQRIDLLIGAEIFFDLILEGKISLGDGLPCLLHTSFGWIAGGNINSQNSLRVLSCNIATMCEELDVLLKAFWEIEEYQQNVSTMTDEEKQCEAHFVDNTTFDEDGRVTVRLPFKPVITQLGSSFEIAHRRFQYLEKRLLKDDILKNMYIDFMNEYISLGHMTLVDSSCLKENHYVIPHHPVLRMQSSSTKLRVVFDASSRTSTNISLNEALMVGPTIQQDLITTMLSFRLHKYALSADICKMYRQFWVNKEERNFQLILWRKNPNDIINLYKLNTVTYGTSSAPFLAIRSIFFIADEFENEFPIGAHVLRTDLYVDDILTGADNIEELFMKKSQIINILKKARLDLSKWNSNHAELARSNEEIVLKTNNEDITKALGMSWKPDKDMFCFRFELPTIEVPTKRNVLSAIAKIFDVLGILGPIIVSCKILIQEMWKHHMDWDTPLEERIKNRWVEIQNALPFINKIEIPRFVQTKTDKQLDVHGFADASQMAYGCCLYIRVETEKQYRASLLISKSKVAPVKQQSLPRLELMAALLLSRTWEKIKFKFENYKYRIFFWSDSKIVLNWLMNHSSSYVCFVANRISEIQNITHDIPWSHVPSKQNPADIISRGCLADELTSTMWFCGPDFLSKAESEWPKNHNESIELPAEEMRKVSLKTTSIVDSVIQQLISRQSSFLRILRIVAYIHRFFNKTNRCQPITSEELQHAFLRVIYDIQKNAYEDEIELLQKGRDLKPSFQKLSPFLHEIIVGKSTLSIIRVGGRLANAQLTFDTKFPLLLPKEHRFTQLFVEHLHHKHLHAGAKALIGILREHVWVVNARDIVRKVVRSCVRCFKFKPRLMQQLMGNLPADRFKAQRPFLVSGVDFCGPFYTSYRIRGKPPYKTYVAIFVCFSSKAVHIELVSDLSTNTFLLCLKRFIGRRGIPLRLYCDNATNFVGANSKLKEFKERYFDDNNTKSLLQYSAVTGFQFSFIPPRSPHFGGLWESAVKSTKTLLLKNMSQAGLTFEEFQTVLVEVEAILNSRPLAARSDDPNDGEALTPGHMLIGSSLLSLPDENFEDSTKVNYLKRWQMVTFLKQQFWQQWVRDYVLTLQQKAKWYKSCDNITNGQLVIMHEDNLPPQHWLLARVINAIPGSDGKVRVVDLKTSKGVFRRAIHKIAPIPTNESY